MAKPREPYSSPQLGRAVGKFKRLPLSRSDYSVYNHLDTQKGDLTAFHYPDTAVLHIQTVIVDEKYQRKGVGSQLLGDAVELARELGARTITAEIRSEEGLALFEHIFGPEHITERLIGRLAIAGSEAPPKLVPYLECPLSEIQDMRMGHSSNDA